MVRYCLLASLVAFALLLMALSGRNVLDLALYGTTDEWRKLSYGNGIQQDTLNLSAPSEVHHIVSVSPGWFSSLNATEKQVAAKHLATFGFEPAELHSFSSPYIVTPVLSEQVTGLKFKMPETNKKTSASSSRKQKLISCIQCPQWMTDNNRKINYFRSCPYQGCRFDPTGNEARDADAVIFFAEQVGNLPPPRYRPRGQIWIHYDEEPPFNWDFPKHYKEEWKSAFNWTMSFRLDSDLWSPYNNLIWRHRAQLLSGDEYLAVAKKKTKGAVALISDCIAPSRRLEYIEELRKHIDVTIYGRCGPLGEQACPKGTPECDNTMSQYKFYLAFENSFCQDYLTEKGLNPYQNFRKHYNVPVMRGGFDYDKYLPSEMFINAGHFKSAKDLGQYLSSLGNNVTRYAQMLKQVDQLTSDGWSVDWCHMCKKVHTNTEIKIIPDIRSWSHEKRCHPPMDDPIFYPDDPFIPNREGLVVDYSNLKEFKESQTDTEWKVS